MPYVIPRFEGEYRFLSNFAPSPIKIAVPGMGDVIFPTGEHVFQAAKWAYMHNIEDAPNYVEAILSNDDPNMAKRMGRGVRINVVKWEDNRIDAMRLIVWNKFKQNPDLRKKLLDTGAAMLVEGNTWGDRFWGRVDGQGNNLLGSILMEVRGYYVWKDTK